jgi:hypothetical protein
LVVSTALLVRERASFDFLAEPKLIAITGNTLEVVDTGTLVIAITEFLFCSGKGETWDRITKDVASFSIVNTERTYLDFGFLLAFGNIDPTSNSILLSLKSVATFGETPFSILSNAGCY